MRNEHYGTAHRLEWNVHCVLVRISCREAHRARDTRRRQEEENEEEEEEERYYRLQLTTAEQMLLNSRANL